jgi:hypothetical protein
MAKKNFLSTTGMIDCACVIHGSGYNWTYVEHLYNMLRRVFADQMRFHVYTEHDRSVPPHMIKHCLDDWGISGPKKSWWYKLQLFNPAHHQGNLLYLDLDMVIVRELDFIRSLDTRCLWGIRDFRYLQRRNPGLMNSSMMWWNVGEFAWVYNDFIKEAVTSTIRNYPGDQDYLSAKISVEKRRFFEDRYFESYRWQCLDGGFDFARRAYKTPGSGVTIQPETAVVVFHGQPKPHQVKDPQILELWK